MKSPRSFRLHRPHLQRRRTLHPGTITARQIEILRAEAARAGDMAQVELCDRALDTADPGMYEARAECAEIIAAAEAQVDSHD